ncbi:MAG: tetratricopeptide repeat protein [Planctomycetota bacterium]
MSRSLSVRLLLLPLCVPWWGACQALPNAAAVPLAASAERSSRSPAENSPSTRPTSALQEPAPGGSDGAQVLAIWNDPDFRRRFAESYLAENDIEPGSLSPDEVDVMDAVLELRGAGKLEEALAKLRAGVVPKSNAKLDLTLAKLLIERERFDEAATALEAAVAKHPKFRRAWSDLGLIRFRAGEHAAAARAFTRVVEQGGGTAMTYGLLGLAHANADDQVSAESAFRMAILFDPAQLDWRLQLAKTFFKQSRFADAASLLGDLIAKQPERSELWLLQAQAYIGLREPSKAAENLELVDRLGQSTAESLTTLGNIYVNGELYDLAALAYERAIGKQAGPKASMAAATALAARGANTEAQRLLDRMQQAYGAQLEEACGKQVLWLRCRLATSVGADEEQAKVLAQITALDPLDGAALIQLGQLHARRGEVEEAVFCYERAAGLADFEADANVRHAQLLVGQSKYSEAVPLLRRAQAAKPRDNIQQFLEQIERAALAKQ